MGELVGLAPGGAREALFDRKLEVDWAGREGFAQVALLAGVPIIPVFTVCVPRLMISRRLY